MFAILVVEGSLLANAVAVGTRKATPHPLGADLFVAFKSHPRCQGEIPYIPASSLVGVTRHLLEKYYNLAANVPRTVRAKSIVAPIHECEKPDDAIRCPVCKLFARRDAVAWFDDGEPDGVSYTIHPGRDKVEIKNERNITVVTLFPKDEVTIPREETMVKIPPTYSSSLNIETRNEITAKGLAEKGWRLETIPRRAQQVSGTFKIGAKFDMSRLVPDDIRPFFVGLSLIQDYYIGRRGTRGYGRVDFRALTFKLRGQPYYEGKASEVVVKVPQEASTPKGALTKWEETKRAIMEDLQKLKV